MRTYFAVIHYFQEILLGTAIIILATLPAALTLTPLWITDTSYTWLYGIAHASLFLVMIVRPLADIFPGIAWLRPLVLLRKGLGVLSASIIVAMLLAKIIVDHGYLAALTTPDYWSLQDLTLFAHLADLSAILLLVTSNKLSKHFLGKNWKRIQRLSYVYFYASAVYVLFTLGDRLMLFYLVVVTIVTALAWLKNHHFVLTSPSTNTATL
jgi:DMSO/TMAO reductase YedYZ heme-binding membrane subunit